MLSHVDIQNFQSLGKVSLELKPFTVILGRSSSGKSAFTRALKTLTSNQRGDSFITHGESQTVIKAQVDRGVVALLRGKKNEYVLIYPEGGKQVFTKLNGSTPEDVSDFIGIPAKDPLNYADQFDMPYLLRSSAGDVARTLGELTNVHVLFEASREANRRRLEASRMLNTRTSDYADLTSDLEKFATLSSDLKVLEEAERIFSAVKERQTRIDRLSQIIEMLEREPDIPAPRDIPDMTHVLERAERIAKLDSLISTVQSAYLQFMEAEENLGELASISYDLSRDYEDALRDLGTCPTCGQDTHDIHDHISVSV